MPSTYTTPDPGTQHTSLPSEQSTVSTVQLDQAEFEPPPPPEHEAPELEQSENEPHETIAAPEKSDVQLIKKKKVKGDDNLEYLVCHTILK